MVKPNQWLIVAIIALDVMIGGKPALADSPAPESSYKEIAPGGKYVFVMISPMTPDEDERKWDTKYRVAIREIRRTYKRSGLYRNDGSTEPLWTVDWYTHSVAISSDGVHLIRPGPWPGGNRYGPLGSALDVEALSFFANGKLLRTYRIRELVDDPDKLPRSVSHFDWERKGQLDDARSEYVLTTLDGNRFVFDIRTGEIISEDRVRRAPQWVWWLAPGIVVAGGLALVIWSWRSRSRVAEAEPGPPQTGHAKDGGSERKQ
jgi:hypothetical protein